MEESEINLEDLQLFKLNYFEVGMVSTYIDCFMFLLLTWSAPGLS